MHGVIVFSTRSGACLFARAFTDNFGLPGEWSTHGDGASTSPTGRSFGAMQLAGLLFAIRAYAEDLPGDDRGGSEDAKDASERRPAKDASGIAPSEKRRFARRAARETARHHVAEPLADSCGNAKNDRPDDGGGVVRAPGALRSWVSGDVSIAFAEHASRGIAVALFAHVDLGAALPAKMAASLLDEFARKHDVAHFGVSGGVSAAPSKSLTFAAEAVECVLAAPAEVARELAASADVGSTWVYVALEGERRGAGSVFSTAEKTVAKTREKRQDANRSRRVSRVGKNIRQSSSRNAASVRLGSSWLACFGAVGGSRASRDGAEPRPEASRDVRDFGAEDDDDDDDDENHRFENDRRDDENDVSRPRLSFVASCAPARIAGASAWCLPLSETTVCAIATSARRCLSRTTHENDKACSRRRDGPDEEEREIEIGRFAHKVTSVAGADSADSASGGSRVFAFRLGRLLVALPEEIEPATAPSPAERSSAAACVRGRVAGDATRLARLMRFAEAVADAKPGPLAFAGAARLDRDAVAEGEERERREGSRFAF